MLERDFWIAIGVLTLNVLLFSSLFKFFQGCMRIRPFQMESLLKHVSSSKIELSRAIILCISALSTYGLYLFPRLNPAIGGGGRAEVEFVLRTDKIELLRRIPLNVSEDGRLGPMPLLLQDSDGFVVLAQFGKEDEAHAVRVSKDVFDAVIYHRAK